MDSPLMYDFNEDAKSEKEDNLLLSDDFFTNLGSSEESFDINALLEKTSASEAESHQLFPEVINTPLIDVETDTHTIPQLSGDPAAALDSAQVDVDLTHNASTEYVKLEIAPDQVIFLTPDELTSIQIDETSDQQPQEESTCLPEDIVYETLEDTSSISPSSSTSCFNEQGSEDATVDTVVEAPLKPVARGQRKATPPSKAKVQSRRKSYIEKNTDEYYERRARNNIAVRKSRDKAKKKQEETESKVKELTTENERLNKKCDLLTKELTVLKGLFINVGATLPPEIHKYLPK